MTPHTGYLEIDGGRLWYEEAGRGAPVLLMHAGVADSRMWDGLFEQLAEHFRTIRFDARGFGRSDLPSGSYAGYDDAAAVLHRLDAAPAAIVSASMGGRAALDLALAHPEVVSAIVTAGSVPSGWQPSQALRTQWDEIERLYEAGQLDESIEMESRMWVDGPQREPHEPDADVRERLTAMNRAIFERGEGEGEERKLDPPALERLGEIRVPVLAIAGSLDQPDMVDGPKQVADGVPGARYAELEAAHMMSMERPEEFRQLVFDFLGVPA